MADPNHFSRQVPKRCLQLLEALLPEAENVYEDGASQDFGPLDTTFILSMAIPIVNLPFERIYQQFQSRRGQSGYADDRQLDPALARTINQCLGSTELKGAEFFVPNHWSFIEVGEADVLNIAGHQFKEDYCLRLKQPMAFERAAAMKTNIWIRCLRNALAHGGIAYLNEDGMPAVDAPTVMLAFVSGIQSEDRNHFVGLRILRIRTDHFVAFLRRWVNFLTSSGLAAELRLTG